MRLCFVLPTKNEEKTIATVIQEIEKETTRLGHEVIAVFVVDDSSDRTREIVREQKARVVIGEGRGLGYAMWKGLKKASLLECDGIVSADTDGQSDLSELQSFLSPLEEGRADFVLGSRFLNKNLIDYNYRFINRLGVLILAKILRKITNLPLTDSHGGLRAMVPVVAQNLEMFGTHSYVQETIIDAAEKGFKIIEVPSVWKKRHHGSSRVVSSIWIYICYVFPVLLIRGKYHMKILFALGSFLLFLSLVNLLYALCLTDFSVTDFSQSSSFWSSPLFFFMGLSSFFFALVLEFLSRTILMLNKNVDVNEL